MPNPFRCSLHDGRDGGELLVSHGAPRVARRSLQVILIDNHDRRCGSLRQHFRTDIDDLIAESFEHLERIFLRLVTAQLLEHVVFDRKVVLIAIDVADELDLSGDIVVREAGAVNVQAGRHNSYSSVANAPAQPGTPAQLHERRSDTITLDDADSACRRCPAAAMPLHKMIDLPPDIQHGKEEYRARYNLKSDYPMVAESYSEARRAMAKSIGLGRKPGKEAENTAGSASTKVKRGGKAAIAAAKKAVSTAE